MSWLKDYFSFSRKERNAFICLLLIIAGFIYLPNFFSPKKTTIAISQQFKKETAVRTSAKDQSPEENENWQTPFSAPEEKKKARLFTFDPNTLDEDGFITLGIPERTARTIINYRNKGGKFRKPDDLRKIYSLKKGDADRVIPYVRIAESFNNYSNKYSSYKKEAYNSRRNTVIPIDINTAKIEEWKSLPGIGDVLSARIIKFRESIGGFSSIGQVAKTYGLRDSTFQLILPYLKLAAPVVNKININTAHENELLECAGITKDIAQAIVIYRKQKGKFQSVEDLKKIVFITEDMFQKMAPCVKAE
jgi:competence protein ComEA